ARGRLTVLDATNVQPESRKKAVAVAHEFQRLPIAIVFDLPEQLCNERNRSRTDRDWNPYLAGSQRQQFLRGMKDLETEGLRAVYRLTSVDEVAASTVVREPL